nr:RNA 2',3'-cyclic phosphodiesterase [Labilithrix luteola]
MAATLDPGFLAEAGALLARLRDRDGIDARWVGLETMHVTLRFFGDTEEARVPAMIEAVKALGQGRAAPPVRAAKLEGYPELRRARVVVIDLEDPSGVLGEMARLGERAAVAAGFPPEARPWTAHLTLGRSRRVPIDLRHAARRPFEPWWGHATSVTLYSSETAREGAKHTPLVTVPF